MAEADTGFGFKMVPLPKNQMRTLMGPTCRKQRQVRRTHLVGTVVARDLLAHDQDLVVADHLLLHSLVERVTDRLSC
jgi:hypothetical protein